MFSVPDQRMAEKMKQANHSLSDELTISYKYTDSESSAVVCLHGLGQSSLFWEGVLDGLPQGWQGYALDLPGFGDSGKLDHGYSIGRHAESVAEFINRLPHDVVALAANSIGGVVAMAVALDQADDLSLDRLILVATGPNVRDKTAATRHRDRLRGLEIDLETARTLVRSFTFRELNEDLWLRVAEQMTKADHSALHETLTSSIATDLEKMLGSIAVPTAVIQGMQDTSRTPQDGLTIAQGVQNGRLVVMPGVGHTPMLEAPDEFQMWFNCMLEMSFGDSAGKNGEQR